MAESDWVSIPGGGTADNEWVPITAQPLAPGVVSDVAQSIPQYGETAVAHTLGIPGDIAKTVGAGASALGIPVNPNAQVYGSPELQAAMDQYLGKQYQPQTAVGQGINTAAGFAPAMLGGPESLLVKGATRVGAPAAAITGIEQSPLPEGAKPWAEVAATLVAPYGAAKGLSGLLSQASKGPMTAAQLGSIKDAASDVYKNAPDPQARAAAAQVWREAAQKYRGAQLLENATSGSTPRDVRAKLVQLADQVKQGQWAGVLSPEQLAQLEKVSGESLTKGTSAITAAHVASKLDLAHASGQGVAGGAMLMHYLVSQAGPQLGHLVAAGVPSAIATVAKEVYPHLNARQIQKLTNRVQAFRQPPTNYSPLMPALAMSPDPNQADQGNQ